MNICITSHFTKRFIVACTRSIEKDSYGICQDLVSREQLYKEERSNNYIKLYVAFYAKLYQTVVIK